MKTYIYNKGRYVFMFTAFAFLFCAVLLFFILVGHKASPHNDPTETDSLRIEPSFTVVIDAGHGGEDGGTVGVNGVYEKDLNLRIAFMIRDILKERNINVVMTRDTDTLLYDKNSDYQGHKKVQDLAARKRIAEQQKNAIFVSIHMNSFPIEKYSGLQVYYSKNANESKALAESITGLCRKRLMPGNERVPKESGNDIYLLSTLKCPAVLIECGFLSNREECELLCDASYQRKMAECLSEAITEYICDLETE